MTRLFPFETADGPRQMGLDLALLDAVDADPSAAVLRFYDWSQPTLSLGYFQRFDDAMADPRWRDVSIVRRMSGGGAIWHDGDLTYSLIVPRSHPAALRASTLYRAVHAAFAETVREFDLEAYRRADRPATAPPSPSAFLCFLDGDPEDILVDRHKILGSAQRRRPRAILQHGSLLLRSSALTPELPGLDRFGKETVDRFRWMDEAARRLSNTLDLDLRPDAPDPVERDAGATHARAIFGNPAWTRRR